MECLKKSDIDSLRDTKLKLNERTMTTVGAFIIEEMRHYLEWVNRRIETSQLEQFMQNGLFLFVDIAKLMENGRRPVFLGMKRLEETKGKQERLQVTVDRNSFIELTKEARHLRLGSNGSFIFGFDVFLQISGKIEKISKQPFILKQDDIAEIIAYTLFAA